MSTFERYLTLWVAACIVAGIVLGQLMPGVFQAIGSAEIAKVNMPVAALIWLMIVPMLVKIDFAALARVREHWRGIGVTLFINWAVKPFSMAALGWLFIGWLFRSYLPAGQIDSYIAGLILLAAAPCTAMVFVWSNLTKGEPHFTLSQVALNDTIMVFAFAPIVGLLLGLSAITVPWNTVYFNAGVAYLLNRAAGEQHCVAGPSALIGASNFFELAVAAAISLFGFDSGAALATVVGVLIEVPVMLSVVRIVNASKGWYEARA
jgi:ACR3 family arsenite transporter